MRLAQGFIPRGTPGSVFRPEVGPAATPTPIRPALPPDALPYVALFLLFVSGGLAFKSPLSAMK